MSYQDELKRLEVEQEEKRYKLEMKHRALDALGELALDRELSVFAHKLYATVGVIEFQVPFSPCTAKGKAPDVELLKELLIKFPPLPKVMVKGGDWSSTSFRPQDDWKGEITPIYPVTIEIKTFQAQEGQFRWYANVAGEVWEIRVAFPLYKLTIGHLDLRWKEYGHGKFREVLACDFWPDHGAKRIRWASGGSEYPNSFTVYWADNCVLAMTELVKG